ncbi:hypothetical protein, partial [Pseudomonas paraeruginosa]
SRGLGDVYKRQALPLLRQACALHAGMATFAEAAVSDRPA